MIRFRLTLMDKDLLGGDQEICSLEAVVTPESLASRESSVLWHRLFFQVILMSLTAANSTRRLCSVPDSVLHPIAVIYFVPPFPEGRSRRP